MQPCSCSHPHARRRIVVTGAPGSGKTAVLETARKVLCRHTLVLPEAAGLLGRAGLPLEDQRPRARSAVQRAGFYLQRELEELASLEDDDPALVVCDRGTIDGSVYWIGPGSLWSAVATTPETEMKRYDAVVHMQLNPQHRDSAQMRRIDAALMDVWSRHPSRVVIESTASFMDKVHRALEALRAQMPACCGGTLGLRAGSAAS